MRSKIGLGTAQFGMDYGVTNVEGRTPDDAVDAILDYARQKGIAVLDTAPAYGTSETVLGRVLEHTRGFEVVTKTVNCCDSPITTASVQQIRDTFYRSLERLRQPSIYGVLVHAAADLECENAETLFQLLTE